MDCNVLMYQTAECTLAMFSIRTQASQPKPPRPLTKSFYQRHLILRTVKAAEVEADCGFLEGRETPQ